MHRKLFLYFISLSPHMLWVGVLVFLTSGCQRLPDRPEGMPELTPCTIFVTFGGQKIPEVGIVLAPKNLKTQPWSAGAQTDEQGKAVLKTAGYYPGVVPGEYTVSFQKFAPEEMRPDGMAAPAKSMIPQKYAPGKSQESIVVSKEKVDYSFALDGSAP